MTSTSARLFCLPLCGLALCLFTYAARAATITTFDVPTASNGTVPTGINASGVVVGNYCDAITCQGFIRDSGGLITSFNPAGATYSYAAGINSAGTITGGYFNAVGGHGFIRNSSGTFTTINVPFTTNGTSASGINAVGTVTGSYVTATATRGFVRNPSGGIVTFGVSALNTIATEAYGINDSGVITGVYKTFDPVSSNGGTHGFVRSSGGAITTFDVPGSAGIIGTTPLSINTQGTVTGYFTDNGTHSFLRDSNGIITTFDAPGATPFKYTEAQSINDSGAVTGYYCESATTCHGFVRDPSGVIVSFDVPGASGTFPYAINTDGMVTGDYQDGTGLHGFIYVPAVSDQITILTMIVQAMELTPSGIETSLTSKLQAAADALQSGRTTSSCRNLDAFINDVNGQSGKHLTTAQALQSVERATQIKTSLGCP